MRISRYIYLTLNPDQKTDPIPHPNPNPNSNPYLNPSLPPTLFTTFLDYLFGTVGVACHHRTLLIATLIQIAAPMHD